MRFKRKHSAHIPVLPPSLPLCFLRSPRFGADAVKGRQGQKGGQAVRPPGLHTSARAVLPSSVFLGYLGSGEPVVEPGVREEGREVDSKARKKKTTALGSVLSLKHTPYSPTFCHHFLRHDSRDITSAQILCVHLRSMAGHPSI